MKPKERNEWAQYLFEKRTQFPAIEGKHKMKKYITQEDFVGYLNTHLSKPISLETYKLWESKGQMPTRTNEKLVKEILDTAPQD